MQQIRPYLVVMLFFEAFFLPNAALHHDVVIQYTMESNNHVVVRDIVQVSPHTSFKSLPPLKHATTVQDMTWQATASSLTHPNNT